MSAALAYTLFEALDRPKGKRVAFDSYPSDGILPAECVTPRIVSDKEELFLWAPATFKNDHRKKENVEQVYALGFDVDGLPATPLATLRQILEPYEAALHSTFHHTAEAPRWRVLVKTSRPMTGAEYELAWQAFRQTVLDGIAVGPQAKDPSRGWFAPGHKKGAPFELVYTEGGPVDLDILLSLGSKKPEPKKPEPPKSEPKSAGAAPRPGRPDRVRRAQLWLDRAEPAVSGEAGSPLAFRIVERVVRGFDLTDNEALDALRDWNRRCVPPWDMSPDARKEDSLIRLIERARAQGDTRVGSLLDEPPKPKDSGSTGRKPVSIAEAFAARKARGPLVHEPTGIASLDRITRGGPTYGSTIMVVGAPEAAKTLVFWQTAIVYAGRGVEVGFLASDEEVDDLVTRLAQRTVRDVSPDGEAMHFTRADYEAGSNEIIDFIQSQIGELSLSLYDDSWSVEKAAADLAARAKANGRRAALFVDSVQSVHTDACPEDAGERRIVAENSKAVRQAAIVHQMITFATSESNREYRKGKKNGESPDAMSAGAESRAIEHKGRCLLVLTVVDGELIEVEIAKNKLGPGRGETFHLRVDLDTQTITDAESPATASKVSKAEAKRQRDNANAADKARAKAEADAQKRQSKIDEADADAEVARAVLREMPDATYEVTKLEIMSRRRPCSKTRAEVAIRTAKRPN